RTSRRLRGRRPGPPPGRSRRFCSHSGRRYGKIEGPMQPRRAPLALLFLAFALLVPAGCKKDSPTAPKAGPTANFVAAPVSGNSPMDVDFTNQSTSGSSPITSVFWSFGDGTNSTQNNPFRTYGTAGTYTGSL